MNPLDYKFMFDRVADIYDIRPDYPLAIIEKMLDLADLKEEATVLEVGTGTGQLTRPLAERGLSILGIELGEKLALKTTENLNMYPKVKVEQCSFEDWCSEGRVFDLFVSAQAFHWVEPGFGLAKVADILKPEGSIALLWHIDRSESTDFYKATTPLWDKYVNVSDHPDRPRPSGSREAYQELLVRHDAFKDFRQYSVNWQKQYSEDDFIQLLNTFSDQIALNDSVRSEFHEAIRKVIRRFHGKAIRQYETVLLFANRQTH